MKEIVYFKFGSHGLAQMLQLSQAESLGMEIHNASYFKACFCDGHWVIDEMQDIVVPIALK